MSDDERYGKSLSGVKWNFVLNNLIYLIQGAQLFIFATLLTPQDFSLVGIVVPILSALFLVSELGFGAALIQKKVDVIDEYASTVAITMLIVSLLLGFVLVGSAEAIAKFYDNSALNLLVKFIAIVILVRVQCSIITSVVIRNMDYKKESLGRLLGVCVGLGAALIILWKTPSYWAVMMPYLVAPLVTAVFYLHELPYTRLKIRFSFVRLVEIFDFSFKLLVANLIFFFSRAGMGLVLAKIYPSTSYGSYYFAQQVSNYPRTFFGALINKIVMSGLSSIQDEAAKFKDAFLKVGRLVSFFTAPAIVLCISTSAEIFELLFGSKWSGALHAFQWLMVFVFISTIGSIPALTLQARGHASAILKANLIRVPLLIGAIIGVLHFRLSLDAFVILFVCIEVVPATYCVAGAIRVAGVSAGNFCSNFLLAPAVMVLSVLLYEAFSLYFDLDSLVSSLIFPLLLYFVLFHLVFNKRLREVVTTIKMIGSA